MVGNRIRDWRVITPLLGGLNFLVTCFIGIIAWFTVRLVSDFDSHLDRIDRKITYQDHVNHNFDKRITYIEIKEKINNKETYSSIADE